MSQILGYCLVNGGSAINHKLIKEVETQQDIERIRERLEDKHNKKHVMDSNMFGEDYYPYKVFFTIRRAKGSPLHP